MDFVELSHDQGITTVTINRPKVNAINEQVVLELRNVFRDLESNKRVKAVILTGLGSFFSFGFDIPGFMDYSMEAFHRFIVSFSELIQRIFIFPKPVVAALNGHTVAGGCILAMACDRRIMVTGKSKIALNELTLGATVFTSVVEILRFTVGSRTAQHILYEGKMNSGEEALSLGLVDELVSEEGLISAALDSARDIAGRDRYAFRNIKRLLRSDALDRIERDEKTSLSDFVEIWYSSNTQEKLKKVEIRS
jgi:Delta3-Delta2-enoyl-CoA isomerase